MEKIEIIPPDFGDFARNYLELTKNDVYPQPNPDCLDGHFLNAYRIIRKWMPLIKATTVLDVGCGEGFCEDIFYKFGALDYIGIALGEDVSIARMNHKKVIDMDFNFIDFPDSYFNLVFARHALEHSPFPIITLMEWHRVSNKWLMLIAPRPLEDPVSYIGRNHYSVAGSPTQLRWWLRRAGWKVRAKFHSDNEFRYLCEKFSRISYEGWEATPLSQEVHDEDRDDFINDNFSV